MSTIIFNGRLDDDRGAPCTVGFEYGLSAALGSTVIAGTNKVTGDLFSYSLLYPVPGRTYHFRAYATNIFGTGYGAILTVLAPALTVATLDASAITESSALLNGQVNGPAETSFEWGETPALGTETAWAYSVDYFNVNITNLLTEHLYYFRARAKTYEGSIITGITRAFVTLAHESGQVLLTADPGVLLYLLED